MAKLVLKGRVLLFISIVMLSALTFTGSGCRLLRRDSKSVAEKKQAEADKKATAEYEKARKAHYKHQSKDARKMMKRTKKQASQFNKPMKRKAFSKTKCD
jgi:type VI protein secretion system component VasK